MLHYTYKISHPSGKYYLGKHSTENLEDGYMGSGIWPRSIKDKSILSKEILEFCDSRDDVTMAEQALLDKHVGCEGNMNFSNNSSGFSLGDLNPSCSEKSRKRMREHNWYSSAAGRKFLSENNPSKLDHIKVLRSIQLKSQWLDPSYRDQHSGDGHHMKLDVHRERMKLDNPSFREEVKEKLRISSKQAITDGKIRSFGDPTMQAKAHETTNSRRKSGDLVVSQQTKDLLSNLQINSVKIECPHCGKVCSKANAKGYHLDKCKYKPRNDISMDNNLEN